MPVGLERLIDPIVAAKTSLNISDSVLQQSEAVFTAQWAAVQARRGSSTLQTQKQWTDLWSSFVAKMPADLKTEPLWADHCTDVDACLGRNKAMDCVCYKEA